mmetsp:Transcript_75438/g.166898  ORF Transcript_75438/g.166898 Transcript_75438/m.166898 type:complete len:694 (+) Transcript_75438:850-2931(+)
MLHPCVVPVSCGAKDEPSNLLFFLHQLGEVLCHLPEDLLVLGDRLWEEACAVLKVEHHQHRSLLLQHGEQCDDYVNGSFENLRVPSRSAVQELAQHRDAVLELLGHDLVQSRDIVRRHRGVQVAEDANRTPQELHGHPEVLARAWAHRTEDGHHLELRRAVRHNVLGQLDLSQASWSLDHHDAALCEGAPRRCAHPGGRSGNVLLHGMDGLVEGTAQHLHDLADAAPGLDAAELLHLRLHGGHDILVLDFRAIHGIVVPREADPPVQREAYVGHAFLHDRREDGDWAAFALHLDGRQSLELHLPGRVAAGLLVCEDAKFLGIAHEARREVHTVSQDRVLSPLVAAANAAVAPARGDAEATDEVKPLEDLCELHAGQHRTSRIVRVDKRGQAEDKEEKHTLVVDEELVQRALVRIAHLLHRGHELLDFSCPALLFDVQAGAGDEYRRDVAHLVDVLQRATLYLFEDGGGDIAAGEIELRKPEELLLAIVVEHRSIFDRGEGILRLVHAQEQVEVGPVLQGAPLDDAVLHQLPSLWTEAGLAVLGERLGYADLLQGRARDQILHPRHMRLRRHHAAHLQDADIAAANTDVQAESHAVDARVEHVQPSVDLNAARRGAQHSGGHGPQVGHAVAAVGRHDVIEGRALRVIDRRKVDGKRIAAELDGVAAVRIDEVDEGREEGGEALREQLGAVALLG